jgi:hypothetical protein
VFEDYYALNFTNTLGVNPDGMAALCAIVDPLVYAANLTMPKLVRPLRGQPATLRQPPCTSLFRALHCLSLHLSCGVWGGG